MELVIRIPDALYNTCKITSKMNGENEVADILIDAVANGTPLPKGHGRLIDADRLRSMYSINRANFNTVVGIQKWIDDAPTIIEADKAENKEYGVNVINRGNCMLCGKKLTEGLLFCKECEAKGK